MNLVLTTVVIILSFALSKGSDVIPKNNAEGQILYLLERWRAGDVDSFQFSLPPLDIIKIPALNGTYKDRSLRLTYSTSEMLVTGVSNFSIVELNVSESNLEASGYLQIPLLNITAENYEIDGRAYILYKLKGSGPMTINIHNVKLFFGYRLGANGTSTTIDDLQFDYEVERIEANLENSSWPINKVLNRDGVKMLNGYRDNIVNATSNALRYYLTDYILTVSPPELFNILPDAERSNLN